MNFNSLTQEELSRNLRDLQRKSAESVERDRLDTLVQELQVHQIELEMHNRALREAQTELEQSVQRYSDLYDHLPIAYLTLNGSGVIRLANRMAHEWLRADKRGLVGQYFGKYLDAYDAGRLAAHLEHCLGSVDPLSIDLTVRPPGADPMFVQASGRQAPSTSPSGEEIHLAITDVTKLKESQRNLQEINREQEAFNYAISHDLRAPLVTINNYAGIVLTDHSAGLNYEGRAMIERIRNAAQRMEETLKHLLQYSALGREDVAMEAVNTEEVIRELLIEHRSMLEEKRAEVTVGRPLPAVRGCAPILNQVLANLLANAVKYTREGETPWIRISAESRPSGVIVKMADRGIGIESKYHEQIFRLFERLHGYSKYPGGGVGLAIARRAAERMNGRIWVESEPGKGSCFCLELQKA